MDPDDHRSHRPHSQRQTRKLSSVMYLDQSYIKGSVSPESLRLFLGFALLSATTQDIFFALGKERCWLARTPWRNLNAMVSERSTWREEPKTRPPLPWLDLPRRDGGRMSALPQLPLHSLCFVLPPPHAPSSPLSQPLLSFEASLVLSSRGLCFHNSIFSSPLTLFGLCPGCRLLPPGLRTP